MRARGILAAMLLAAAVASAVPALAEDEPTTATTVPTTVPPSTTVPDEAPPPTTAPPPPTTALVEPVDPSEPAPAVPAARTLTATPDAGLVHDQIVIARGRGWGQGTLMGAAQCVATATSIAGCGSITLFSADRVGNFRREIAVDVLLETRNGVRDCRVVACVLAANTDYVLAGAVTAPLAFDPAGPDPVRRTAAITPDVDLVDGQTVTVTADGFPAQSFVEILQCRDPVTSYDDCGLGVVSFARADGTGRLDASVDLAAILDLGGGARHDCRTGGCVLSVRPEADGLAEAALVPLAFDPAAPLVPPPTMTVDPNVDLLDGDVVRVTSGGWRPDAGGFLVQCETGVADPQAACDPGTLEFVHSDANGEWEVEVGLFARLFNFGGSVDCRVDGCDLVAIDPSRLARFVAVPLGFDPAGPLIAPTVEITSVGPFADGDVVRVEGGGARPGGGLELAQCLASATGPAGCGRIEYLELPDLNRSGDGTYTHQFTVEAGITVRGGRTVDCRVQDCVIAVSDVARGFVPSDRAALDLLPPVPGPLSATPTFTG